MNPLQGADKHKLNKLGKYLSFLDLEILSVEPTTEDLVIAKLYIGNKINNITFEISNRINLKEFVKNCFNGDFGEPTKFELNYVHDLIRDIKNLYYRKHCLQVCTILKKTN